MNAAISSDLRAYAVRRWPTANHKYRKARLASLLGMSERRVRSFWEATRDMSPRAEEVDAIKALIGQEEADEALADRIADLEAQVAFLVAAITRDEMAAGGTQTHASSNGGTGQGQAVPRRRSTDRT